MTLPWWRQPVIVLIAGGIVLGLGMGLRQTYGLFIDPLHQATGVSVASISLAIAIQNLLWGTAAPVAGVIADRYGSARVLIVGGLLYGSGLAVTALAQSDLLSPAFMIHFGAGVLVGLGVGAVGFPLVLSAVARIAPEEKRSAWLGIASSGGSVGMFLLLPGSQALIDAFGWNNALLVLGCLALLVVPLTASVASPPVADASLPGQSLGGALREAGGHRGYLLLTAGFFVCGFHVAFVATHLPGYIVSCNLDPSVGAAALGLVGLFNIFGGLLGGRFRKKYLLSLIYLARAVVIGAFLLGPKTELAVWLFSASFGLLWLSTVPLTSGLVGQIFGPRFLATLFGLVLMSHQVGAFFGAWFGGLSVDLTGGYGAVWWASVLLGLLAAALHWPIADRPVERPALQAAG